MRISLINLQKKSKTKKLGQFERKAQEERPIVKFIGPGQREKKKDVEKEREKKSCKP